MEQRTIDEGLKGHNYYGLDRINLPGICFIIIRRLTGKYLMCIRSTSQLFIERIRGSNSLVVQWYNTVVVSRKRDIE